LTPSIHLVILSPVRSCLKFLPIDHRLTARHGAVLKGKLPEAFAPSMSLDT
jgi:hypothetical protein